MGEPSGERWTICAPGPSLRRVTNEHLPKDGPVVVINNAAASPLRRNFWSCVDPTHKFDPIFKALDKDQRHLLGLVWCRERHEYNWNQHGLQTWAYPSHEPEFRSLYIPHAVKRTTMLSLTITATMARCVGLGASRIDLWGVDMAGAEHSHGADPDRRPVQMWSSRWKREKDIFEMAVLELESLGVAITRNFVDPQPQP